MKMLSKRLEKLEAQRPAVSPRDGRKKLAAFLETLTARLQPSPDEQEPASDWLKTEWPHHLERIKSR